MRKLALALVFALSVAISFVRAGHADDVPNWQKKAAQYKTTLKYKTKAQLYRERDKFATANFWHFFDTDEAKEISAEKKAIDDEIERRYPDSKTNNAAVSDQSSKAIQPLPAGNTRDPNTPPTGSSAE